MAAYRINICDRCKQKIPNPKDLKHIRIYNIYHDSFIGNAVEQYDICIYCLDEIKKDIKKDTSIATKRF